MGRRARPTMDRIMERVVVDPVTGCWVYTGTNLDGYGYIKVRLGVNQKKLRRVHIVTYEHFVGLVPEGLVLDHEVCDNRACCNPRHLVPKTNRENILRGTAPTALNARKTHCPAGHPYDEENTYAVPTGGRGCRSCRREHTRKWRATRSASGSPN